MRTPEATISKSVQARGLNTKLKCLRNDYNYIVYAPETKLGVVPGSGICPLGLHGTYQMVRAYGIVPSGVNT